MKLENILKKLSTSYLKLESGFDYGPQGRLLLRNIENLWFHNCVTVSRYNVFLTGSEKFGKTIQDLKEANVDTLPLGFAAFENSKIAWNQSLLNLNNSCISHKVAKITTFSEESCTKDLFYKKQRERKAWWRKLVQQPSRFVLTESKKGKNSQAIDIEAHFPFGKVTVETVTYQKDVRKLLYQDKNVYNDSELSAVEHITSLDWGCFALLCDSYKENTSSSEELQMQPKIAPYKATCKVNVEIGESDSVKEDLHQLVLYINNLLRTSGLSTVLINENVTEKSSYESLHIPFVIGVDKSSLKNGIVKVTSQVTTLAESVHLTQLVDHIALQCT